MTLIPDWFQDNFVDVEQLIIDMYAKILPAFEGGRWTPDSWLDQIDPDPMLTVIRLPGGYTDWDKGYDECLVQISIVTGNPDSSKKAMDVVRATLLPIQGFKFMMADGFTALIHKAAPAAGPQMLTAQQQLDTRVVNASFMVRVGLKSRIRYEQLVRSL